VNRLKQLTAVALPAVLASAVAAADPDGPVLHPITPTMFRPRGPATSACDTPVGPFSMPYGGVCPPGVAPPTVPTPTQPGQPPTTAPDQVTPPSPETAPFSFTGEASALALSGGSASVNMAGSLNGVSYITTLVRRQTFPAQFPIVDAFSRQPIRLSNPIPVPVDFVSTIQAFDATRGTALIAENESPRPQTRAYARFQYFGGVPAITARNTGIATVPAINDPALLAAVQTEIAFQNQIEAAAGNPPILGTPADAARILSNQVLSQLTPEQLALLGRLGRNKIVHREVFGFEAAFWNNIASVGLRVPTFQQSGDGSFGRDDFGDLTAIFKVVIWDDRATGDLLSGGLAVTAPTGPGIETIDGTVRSVLLQPYLGSIHNFTPRLSSIGFMGLVVPTDERDVTFLYTDFGLYYTMYRNADPNAILTALIPAAEVHVITPLNHRGTESTPIGMPDLVTFTGAVHAFLADNILLYGAVCVPVTGPKPFDIEAQAVLEYRF
jgi:hypothetical protein